MDENLFDRPILKGLESVNKDFRAKEGIKFYRYCVLDQGNDFLHSQN